MIKEQQHPSSFRDPSGSVFVKNGTVYRRINQSYETHYKRLLQSGLYYMLVAQELLIPHEEIGEQTNIEAKIEIALRNRKISQSNLLSDSGLHVLSRTLNNDLQSPCTVFKVIRPEPVTFITYPYEWCFSQLKDAALVTLQIQKLALEHNMTLKDASAFNIQFVGGIPMLIDTLSFECWEEGTPWVAYRQFCQHFLAPLALMSYVDPRLNTLFKTNIDGVPLDLAAKLLPKKVWLKPSLVMHLLAHARVKNDTQSVKTQSRFSKAAMRGLIENLEASVQGLKSPATESIWSQYYGSTNYSEESMEAKQDIVSEFLTETHPKSVWDLGANVGLFSAIAANLGAHTVSMDSDPVCVERNYLHCKATNQRLVLPLVVDLTQPSPNLGWANQERSALETRGKADVALALALIHHLAIANNVPLVRIAKYLSQICRHLIIEFVPKEDSQVQTMLANRVDVFTHYTQDNFENQFATQFEMVRRIDVAGTSRTVYLMRSKNA